MILDRTTIKNNLTSKNRNIWIFKNYLSALMRSYKALKHFNYFNSLNICIDSVTWLAGRLTIFNHFMIPLIKYCLPNNN